MQYRSILFRILSLLFVLSFALSVMGPVQAFSVPDGQRSVLQTGKIQSVLASDYGMIPPDGGVPARKDYLSVHLAKNPRITKGFPSLPMESKYGNPRISELYPSVSEKSVNDQARLLEEMIKSRTNQSRKPDFTSRILSPVTGTGTVTYIELEGGFYGIVADDGNRYLPSSLPGQFQVDGLRVQFRALPVSEPAGIHMWGNPVSILSIQEDTRTISAVGEVTWIDLEGGFYGIVTSNGTKYLPLDLTEEFAHDGMTVEFTAVPSAETATIAMWGIPVKILTISLIREGEGSGQFLSDSSWILVRYSDGSGMRTLIPGTEIIANFDDAGKITGTAGCNIYFAEYVETGTSLHVSSAGMTEMYCMEPEGVMEQERRFMNLLSRAAGYQIQEGQLVIQDDAGRQILVFERFEPSPREESEMLLQFTRTGGFAGFDDTLVVYQDGTAEVTRKEYHTEIRLTAEEINILSTMLENAEFSSLEEYYPAEFDGADYFIYSVMFNGKTVIAEDTGVPESIMPLVVMLSDLVNESAPDDVIPPRPSD